MVGLAGARRLQHLSSQLCARNQEQRLPAPSLSHATEDVGRPRETPFTSYSELLDVLEARGHRYKVVEETIDGSPLIVVQCGGTKEPAVFISAGAHSTEQAGVVAAVELCDEIQTEHVVYIVPCRDPIGLTGFNHALALGLGKDLLQAHPPQNVSEAAALLRERAGVLCDNGTRLVALAGDHAYTISFNDCRLPSEDSMIGTTELPFDLHTKLRGKRIWWPSNWAESEGGTALERAYTQFGPTSSSPQEVLHINRFHDTEWAPPEVMAARRVMGEVQPRLVIDLHEHDGDDFWMSARHQVHCRRQNAARKSIVSGLDSHLDVDAEDEEWEEQMATAVGNVVAASGIPLHRPGRKSNNTSDKEFFFDLGPGVFWLDAGKRGEGLNLADFGADQYGPAFTVETGLFLPFQSRVRTAKLVAQTLVDVFARRY